MNGQVGLALAGGYLMGRRHKMRLALTLAGMAAGRRLASGRPTAGLGQAKSSELGKLTKEVRGQLVSAGRTAAVSAASQRIDALSDRLEARATSLRAAPGESEAEEEPPERPTRKTAPERETTRDTEGEGGERRSKAQAREPARAHPVKHKSSDRPAAAKKKTGAQGPARRSRG